uniref:DNA-methyltransferase n=1 Tax=Jeotgalibaca porci TaxID=1868793 RepID=UPI00359F78D3
MAKDIELWQGDCLELMKDIPDGSVDLIITSPPYNIGKSYKTYKDDLELKDYLNWCALWLSELKRVVTENGSIWINSGYLKMGANETRPLTYEFYNLMNLPLVQEVIWHYEGGMTYKKRFTHRTERWQWYSKKPNSVTFNLDDVRDINLNRTKDKRNHPLGKNPTDYWYFNRVVGGRGKSKEKTEHPAQFPVDMVERVVKACSDAGDTVMDNFMGSGTTGVACKRLNRNFIGIELDETYFNLAKERIESAGEINE